MDPPKQNLEGNLLKLLATNYSQLGFSGTPTGGALDRLDSTPGALDKLTARVLGRLDVTPDALDKFTARVREHLEITPSLPKELEIDDFFTLDETDEIEEILLKFILPLHSGNSMIPPLDEEYLSIIHNVEVHYGPQWRIQDRKSHQLINSIFDKSIRFGGARVLQDVTQKRAEYLGSLKPFFPPNTEIQKKPKRFYFFGSFPALVPTDPRSTDSIDNLEYAIKISVNLSELLKLLEEYANLKIVSQDFEEAAHCYHFSLRYSENIEKKKQIKTKIRYCKTNIMVSSPFTTLKFDFPSNNSKVKENQKLIDKVEKVADIYFFSDHFHQASLIYKDLILFIQGLQTYYRLKKIDHVDIDTIGKTIFMKFCYAHLGTTGDFILQNVFRNRLTAMRREYTNSKQSIEEIRVWNTGLVRLLRGLSFFFFSISFKRNIKLKREQEKWKKGTEKMKEENRNNAKREQKKWKKRIEKWKKETRKNEKEHKKWKSEQKIWKKRNKKIKENKKNEKT